MSLLRRYKYTIAFVLILIAIGVYMWIMLSRGCTIEHRGFRRNRWSCP